MTLDPNIILAAGGGANRLQMEGPIDVATRFQQLQRMKQQAAMGDMELQNAQEEQAQQRAMREVFARNTNPDGSVNRAGVLSDLGRVNPMARMKMEQTWSAQDGAALKQQIDLKEALAKLDKNQREQTEFETEQLGRVLGYVRSLPEEQRAAAWDQGVDVLGRQKIDVSAYKGKYNPQLLEMLYSKAVDVKTAFGDSAFTGWHAGADDTAYQVNNRGEARPIIGPDGKPVKARAQAPVNVNIGEKQQFKDETTLRHEYNAGVKPFQEIKAAHGRIKLAENNNSAASDISLIYSYMKMMDPGSVVREGEFATAQNAGGIPDRIRAAYNKAVNGERLAPDVKADFIRQADLIFERALADKSQLDSRYSAIAEQYRLNPKNIIIGEAESRNDKVAKTKPAQSAPKPGDVQDGYVFNGGNPADPKNWKKVS